MEVEERVAMAMAMGSSYQGAEVHGPTSVTQVTLIRDAGCAASVRLGCAKLLPELLHALAIGWLVGDRAGVI